MDLYKWEVKTPFNKKKPLAELGSATVSQLLGVDGVKGNVKTEKSMILRKLFTHFQFDGSSMSWDRENKSLEV